MSEQHPDVEVEAFVDVAVEMQSLADRFLRLAGQPTLREALAADLRGHSSEARSGVKAFDELFRGRGWLSDAEKLERSKLEGRCAGFDAAADIVDGVPV